MKYQKAPVAIVGIGAVTPYGVGVAPMWRALKAGKSCIDSLPQSINGYAQKTRIGGYLEGFDPQPHLSERVLVRTTRSSQFALIASAEAVKDAQLTDPALNTAVVIGSGYGNYEYLENMIEGYSRHRKKIPPMSIPIGMINAIACNISIAHGFKGANLVVSTACSSGAYAIHHAMDLIQSGQAEAAVAGGVDCPVVPLCLSAWEKLRVLCDNGSGCPAKAMRPFAKGRRGFVLSEGAGMLVLMDLQIAQQQGKHIYATLIGGGRTSDAAHLTKPSLDGMARAIRLAIENADGISKADVDYINAHGTSTVINDKLETEAIKQVFGRHSYKLAINSSKSMMGHSMGASSALECIITALSLKEGFLHPTVNCEEQDPDCDLDYVREGVRHTKVKVAMSNSFGFGGHNSALALRYYEGGLK